jgi:hypothetical protein
VTGCPSGVGLTQCPASEVGTLGRWLIAKTDLGITLLQFVDYFRRYAAATRHKFQVRIHLAQHIGRSMSKQDQTVGRRVWDCH